MTQILRIATRKSPLALWQAENVKQRLQAIHPDLEVELVTMKTQGDKILDTPLAKIGGKGLFVKELEQGILENRADIAVHSMKDVPMEFPEGLYLSTILKREEPRDAFVSNHHASAEALPQGAVVGTCSLRRRCQLLQKRPDLIIKDLRGNVNTRLAKLDAGEFDAIVLASAGLIRLEMEDRIRQRIDPEFMLPAVGQGAVGIEIRVGDADTLALLSILDDTDTIDCILAERAFNYRLHGGCQVPIAGYATLDGDTINMRGLVGEVDGSRIIESTASGPRGDAEKIGTALANDLLAQGAKTILDKLYE